MERYPYYMFTVDIYLLWKGVCYKREEVSIVSRYPYGEVSITDVSILAGVHNRQVYVTTTFSVRSRLQHLLIVNVIHVWLGQMASLDW